MEVKFCLRTNYMLPVGGGAGVEDVLLGREQRQAVGIKVDRLRAHDGKSFQTTPAASVFTGPDGFRGRSFCGETASEETPRVVHGRENSSKDMQVHAATGLRSKLERALLALRAHSVEETATALWSLCSGVE